MGLQIANQSLLDILDGFRKLPFIDLLLVGQIELVVLQVKQQLLGFQPEPGYLRILRPVLRRLLQAQQFRVHRDI